MIKLTQDQYQQIIEHGLSGKPLEICGLLAGAVQGGDSNVLEVHRVESLDKSALTYSMNGLDYARIERDVTRRGLKLVGIYHTHPATVPYPSVTDVARAHWEGTDDLLFPDFSYLIVSLRDPANPEPRSFKIEGHRIPEDIREEEVVIS